MIEIVEAQPWHAIALCEDLREREALAGLEPRALVQEVARSCVAWAGLNDGHVAALWGAKVDGLLSDEAYIWLACGREMEKNPITFLRHSRRAITDLRHYFRCLHGLVLTEFGCSVRWLEWLGFEVGPDEKGVRRFIMRGYPS